MLAAEPVFHKQTPGGVKGVAAPFGHGLSNLPELIKNFMGDPPAQGPVEALPITGAEPGQASPN
jgi:hypothetical protein